MLAKSYPSVFIRFLNLYTIPTVYHRNAIITQSKNDSLSMTPLRCRLNDTKFEVVIQRIIH